MKNKQTNGSCLQGASSTYAEIRKFTPSNVQLVTVVSGLEERCMLPRQHRNGMWRNLGVRQGSWEVRNTWVWEGTEPDQAGLVQQVVALGLTIGCHWKGFRGKKGIRCSFSKCHAGPLMECEESDGEWRWGAYWRDCFTHLLRDEGCLTRMSLQMEQCKS